MTNRQCLKLGVVIEMERFVAIDKPAGLLSVPGKGEANRDCVAVRVQQMYPEATGPLIVHRLDMATSGLMVVALDAGAHRELSMQFEARTVGKRYEALLDGVVDGESGEVRLWHRVDIDDRPRQMLDREHGKEAITRWRLLGVEEYGGMAVSRVEFLPETGRSHQLRVASATKRDEGGLGCAILGDDLYGDPVRAERLMLHAKWLAFDGLGGGERVEVASEVEF